MDGLKDPSAWLAIRVADALIIKPGDRVLLLVNDEDRWTRDVVDEVRAQLGERFPDAEFAFMGGVKPQVVVERQTCQDNPDDVFASGSHLHECERELDHRSRVHRCACGAQWWRPEETPDWEAGDG